MPGADGSIWIKIKADDEQAHKELVKLNKDISKTEKNIENLGKKKMPILEQVRNLSAQLDSAKAKLANMQSGDEFFPKATIKAQQSEVNALQKQFDGVADKLDRINLDLQDATNTLASQKNEAGKVEQRIASVGPGTRAMADAMEEAKKRTQDFEKRLKALMRRVLVFSVFTMALRSMREWMGKVIKTNAEATAAMARLKGALLTLAQPLVNVIIPAFTALVNVLSAVVGRVASLVSSLFGTTASASADAAEALYKETEALEGTGSAAKKAGKSLAAFDEINQLSDNQESGGSSSKTIAPDFSWADTISDKMEQIADAVLLIAAGLALWKIGTILPGALGTIATKLAGILILVGGLILFWNGLTDAWENGVDWKNLALMIAGVAVAALGLWLALGGLAAGIGLVVGGLALFAVGVKDAFESGVDWQNLIAMISGVAAVAGGLALAFGSAAAGIGLVVGGLALLVIGVKDMIENGFNFKNMLLTISGILATGLGITLLTGSYIPILIAAIAAILLAITGLTGNGQQLIDNLKQAFRGLVDFIAGIITGDMKRAGEGLKNFAKGIFNSVLTIFGSLVNLIIKGLNWLIEKINSIEFDVPEWVPFIGGKKLSPSIGPIKEWQIPQLAQGAVIPPNREFLAILGDQKSGTNIETPLSTMVDAFKQAINETGMGGNRGGGDIVLKIDGKTFARVTNPYYKSENGRIGVKMVNGV